MVTNISMSHAFKYICHSLCALQVRYPDRITLIRGNHESRQITQVLAAQVPVTHFVARFACFQCNVVERRFMGFMMSAYANMALSTYGATALISLTTSGASLTLSHDRHCVVTVACIAYHPFLCILHSSGAMACSHIYNKFGPKCGLIFSTSKCCHHQFSCMPAISLNCIVSGSVCS